MIHFDFIVDDIDAENIMDCIEQERLRMLDQSVSGHNTKTEQEAFAGHAIYLQSLKEKMKNRSCGDQNE